MEKTGWFITREDGLTVQNHLLNFIYHAPDCKTADTICELLHVRFNPAHAWGAEYSIFSASKMSDNQWVVAVDQVRQLTEQASDKPNTPADDKSSLGLYVACRRFHKRIDDDGADPEPVANPKTTADVRSSAKGDQLLEKNERMVLKALFDAKVHGNAIPITRLSDLAELDRGTASLAMEHLLEIGFANKQKPRTGKTDGTKTRYNYEITAPGLDWLSLHKYSA